MVAILAFVAATIFIIGLYQWAQGGASLWRIFSIRQQEKDLTSEEKARAEREVKELEQSADRSISASFRIIAVLAVLVWLFLGATIIFEMLGINWVSAIATRAKTYWANPAFETTHSTMNRNEVLRNMGNNLRR